MTDRIVLSGVSGTGHHGVFEHEKRDGQTFVVDVALDVALASAGRSDDLARTVNYGEIGAQVLGRIEGEPFDLIERLAEVIAEDVLAVHRLVDEVTVTVHKPQAPVGVPFGDVTVCVTRRRAPVPVVIALGATSVTPRPPSRCGGSARCPGRPLRPLGPGHLRNGAGRGPDQPAYLNCVVTDGRVGQPHDCWVLFTRSRQITVECGKSVGVQGRSTSTSSSGESPGVPRSGVAIWTTSRCPTRERRSAASSWRPGSTSIPRRGFAWEKRSWRSRNS